MTIVSTLGDELNRAEADQFGKVMLGGGLLEMKIVRGEEHDKLKRKVIVEEDATERRLYFVDPLSGRKSDFHMALRLFPPIR